MLEQDATENFVQPVSLERLQQNLPPFGTPLKVGSPASQIVISGTGTRLYVPFLDDLTLENRGGVAVLEVSEVTCGEILWQDLEGCAHCDQANCVVLATIEDYHLDEELWDPTNPPSDPAADQGASIARINNRTRRLLPSTQTLYELTKCLLEHGGVGPQGPAGEDGVGLDDVELTLVNCGTAASATIVVEGAQRVLKLVIPGLCDPDLTHISGVNWTHAGAITQAELNRGVLVAFDHPVFGAGINEQTAMLLTTSGNEGLRCWCEVRARVIPGDFQKVADVTTQFTPQPNAEMVNGIQFLPPLGAVFGPGTYRVVVKGNFIIDAANKKAIDADHMPPWFSNPPQPFQPGDYETGNGVAGGTFESWFSIANPQFGDLAVEGSRAASKGTSKRKS